MRNRVLACLAVAALAAGCGDQQDSPTGVDPQFASSTSKGNLRINVLLRAPATQANLTELARYGTVADQVPEINGVTMRAKAEQLPRIQALSFVKYAGPDAAREAIPVSLVAADDFSGGVSVWNQDAINVTDQTPAGGERTVSEDGDGVYVAVLDTGLLPTWREYFPAERIATEFARSFGGGGQDNGSTSEQPNKWEHDVDAHGTHVSSIILGFRYNSAVTGPITVNGTAPRVKVIPVKVLNQTGSNWSSVIARGVTYVGGLKAKDGPLANARVVINMSLGGSVLDPFEKAALDYAIDAGVVIVASAGNSGPTGVMGYPGGYTPVISVAAAGFTGEWENCGTSPNRFWRECDVPDPSDVDDLYITDFSSRQGAKQDLDVAAPGSWVVGPYQDRMGQLSWFFVGGTSQAAPHVAGIVALMMDKAPGVNFAERVTNPDNPDGDQITFAEEVLQQVALPLGAGSREVRPGPGAPHETVTWGADASGHGFVTADAALGGI